MCVCLCLCLRVRMRMHACACVRACACKFELTRAIQATCTSEAVSFSSPLTLFLSFSLFLSLYQKADGLVGICRNKESGHSNAFTLDLTLYDDVVA